MSEEHQKSLVNQDQNHDLPNDIIQHIFNYLSLKDIFSLISLNKIEKKFIEAFIWFIDTSKSWIRQIFSTRTTPQTRTNFRQQLHVYLHGPVPKTITFKGAILDTRYLILTKQDWLSPHLNLNNACFFLSHRAKKYNERNNPTYSQPSHYQARLQRTHLHNIVRLVLQSSLTTKIKTKDLLTLLKQRIVLSSTPLNNDYSAALIMMASFFYPVENPTMQHLVFEDIFIAEDNVINFDETPPIFFLKSKMKNTQLLFKTRNFHPLAFLTVTNPWFVTQHILKNLDHYLLYPDLEETLNNLHAEIIQFFNLMSDLAPEDKKNLHDQSRKEILTAIDIELKFLNKQTSLKQHWCDPAQNKFSYQITFQTAMANDGLTIEEKIKLFDVFSPRVELNRHRNPTFDRLFGIHNTTSWRDTWKTIRNNAKNKLFTEVDQLHDQKTKIALLEKAKQAHLFKTHRNNSFFRGAFGRTQAVIDIENKMAEINAATAIQVTV